MTAKEVDHFRRHYFSPARELSLLLLGMLALHGTHRHRLKLGCKSYKLLSDACESTFPPIGG
jgi:hypothetical protein